MEDFKQGKHMEDDFEIEVIDDTPEEDRGREPMPKHVVDDFESDGLDDYDDRVKQRVKQATKLYHDERRNKEAAERERLAAISFAEKVKQENAKLQELIRNGEQQFFSTAHHAAETELQFASQEYERAFNDGDTQKLLAAQKAITEAQLKAIQAKNYTPTPLQQHEFDVQSTNQQQVNQRLDPKVEAWIERNPWFLTNKEMQGAAQGLHQRLVDEGADIGTDEYFATIDTVMRRRFPEAFEKSVQKQRSSVAPVSRSTSSTRVQITASEASLAKRMGITPEQYAKEKLRLEGRI